MTTSPKDKFSMSCSKFEYSNKVTGYDMMLVNHQVQVLKVCHLPFPDLENVVKNTKIMFLEQGRPGLKTR